MAYKNFYTKGNMTFNQEDFPEIPFLPECYISLHSIFYKPSAFGNKITVTDDRSCLEGDGFDIDTFPVIIPLYHGDIASQHNEQCLKDETGTLAGVGNMSKL